MVTDQPLVLHPLSVSIQSCGKKRLLLDLRHVNKSLIKQSVKYEDWKIAVAYFAKDAYMFSFDIKAVITIYILRKSTKCFWGFHGGRLIPLMKNFMFSLCSSSARMLLSFATCTYSAQFLNVRHNS